MSPYIVTVKRRDRFDVMGADRDEWTTLSHRAVATLEVEPLADVLRPLLRHSLRALPWVDMMNALIALPESGGTVGPLPDGTVIEVEATTWHAIAVAVNFLDRGYVTEAEWPELIAAYNARQEDAPSRINVEDTGYRGGGLMGRREAKP